jgi:hypothetical protein
MDDDNVQEFDPREGEQTTWVTATDDGIFLPQLALYDFMRKVKGKKSFGGKVRIQLVQVGLPWAIEVSGPRRERNETLVYLTDRLLAAGYTWAFTIDDFTWLKKD